MLKKSIFTVLLACVATFVFSSCASTPKQESTAAPQVAPQQVAPQPPKPVDFNCKFAEGGWNSADWKLVKSPRFPQRGGWVQEADHIRNRVPEGYAPKDIEAKDADAKLAARKLLQGKLNPETYCAMVMKDPVTGHLEFSATMAFDYLMAPELVIANDIGAAEDGYPEFREHWEIVLFNEGVNVWHHEIKDGKPFWRKASFIRVPFEANKPYKVTGTIRFTAKCPDLTIVCSDPAKPDVPLAKFGCMLPTLSKTFSAGVIACEGINMFYDFSAKSIK